MSRCPTWLLLALSLTFDLNGIVHAAGAEQGGRWANEYDKEVNFQCEEGQFLQAIFSVYASSKRDRRFYLSCRRLPYHIDPSKPTCSWSGYVNDYDRPVNYRCPAPGYIAGLQSVHLNSKEDRRHKIYCCHMPRTTISGCQRTGNVNDLHGGAAYTVPVGKVLRGMFSIHTNSKMDRVFQYEACDINNVWTR